MSKIAIIGTGPAGMMAAITVSQNGHDVDLYDRNEKIGKKLFITGKGRCNLTNACDISDYFERVIHNHQFLYSALYSFTNENLMALMEENGVKLKIERGERVFPISDKSNDIINGFYKAINKKHCHLFLNSKIVNLKVSNDEITGIQLETGEIKNYDAVILGTGGKSYPTTGSDGNMFKCIEELGHRMMPLSPSLVPMNTKEAWPKSLQGLALKNVELTLCKKNKKGQKKIKTLLGEMLFTHFGVSGPLVLSLSSYISGNIKDYTLFLDLKPGLSNEQLEKRLQRDFEKYSNKDFSNALGDLLPSKMIPIMVELSEIDPKQKVNQITKEERKKLITCFKTLEISIASLRDFNEAIVTSGGIDVKEVDPGTMESKKIKNLYFIGEMLDVDALTGGFNIQIAASTGYLAGSSIK
jgi:predicted Rossmann fold flavoprotein